MKLHHPEKTEEIEKLSLAVGGKIPFVWSDTMAKGIFGSFTKGEREIAIALKRELDPAGILNPNLNL